MRRFFIFSLVVTPLLLGLYDAADFNARDRKHQPVPSGHIVGKDNGTGIGAHYAGEDCGICHTPGGKAGALVFSMSGTIYADRLARRPAVGAEVVMQDIDGSVLSMTTNAVGNFWTTAAIGSNPLAIASHGGTTHLLYEESGTGSADPEDTRTWQYKGWINYEGSTRHMATIVPVGGASNPVSRMSCNMHHAGMGSSGAAWVSSQAAVAHLPTSMVSFKKHVLPVLAAKCIPCHIPGTRVTRLVTSTDVDPTTPTTIDYSAGSDFTNYAETAGKQGFRDVVDPTDPDNSYALIKTRKHADGSISHGGGGFWNTDDREYRMIRAWIAEGALNN